MKISESETLELKKSTSELKEAIVSIVAMLNKHQHGEVFFGVTDKGKPTGLTITEQTLREVSRTISENIEPKVFPTVRIAKFEGVSYIHVSIEGDATPYYSYGRAYMRVGDEDRKLSAREIEGIILRKNEDRIRWDSRQCRDAKTADISRQKLKAYLKKADLPYDTNALSKLGLLSGGRPVNAAVLLLGKKPEKFFSNAKLRCAVFATEDTVTPIDMQDYTGDTFSLIELAEQYFLRNIHIGMRLEGLYRVDIPEVDKEAFREAIINAFCHRDYWHHDPIQVAIFKDRVEVRSPGLLYGGLTIEKITTEMVSERRNRLVADLFHKVHYVEQWGRGIKLILTKAPETTFKEVGTHFIVTFKRDLEKDRVKDLEKDSGLTRNQKRILIEIRKNKHATQQELSIIIGINEKNIRNNIAKLKEKGLVRRVGPDKGGHWEAT
ncbi:MAG: ATP-binding protein [Nanoarchaeota archaeon]